ncbi:MAG: hypothetical protein LBR08_10455 [Bacteroidales bacterium]|jgi:hypothetical protein|nr:hypothetical protein [Bacteroidales bacterium]
MDRVYNKITETLEANAEAFTRAGLTPPAVVDVFMGQPDVPQDFEFVLPAVFFDCSADFDGETLLIDLHVLTDFMEDTENIAPDRNRGLYYFRFLNVIKRCLKGMKTPPVFGPLVPYRETPVRTDFYNYHLLTFRCVMHEELDDRDARHVNVDFVKVFENGRLRERP